SMLVGRWPGGAPMARTPLLDDLAMGANRDANDHFGFGAHSVTLPLTEGKDDNPPAQADPLGILCPVGSHIRKVNNRDAVNDRGGRRATFSRRILRRGLPFGPLLGGGGAPDPVAGNRGLLFVSYQTSISDQFEFLTSEWMGDSTNPGMPGGHDMVVGQNGQPGQSRERRCVVPRIDPSGLHLGEVHTTSDFVIPTGGGYFFSPSISAIRDVLGA
ncbi:MAG: peroxidase, partial [Candidatus Dormibacteria bacterium]